MLFGVQECVAITIAADGSVRGLRCVIRHRNAVVTAAETLPPDRDGLAPQLKKIGALLGVRRDHILVIGSADCRGVFFRTELPEMPKHELENALALEAPRHLLYGGENAPMAFWAKSADNGRFTCWVWTAPAEQFAPLWQILNDLRWRPDAVLSPYFAAAPLGGGNAGSMYIPDFDPDFFWENGSFHPQTEGVPRNIELKKRLGQEISVPEKFGADFWNRYLACGMLCCCMRHDAQQDAGIRDFDTLLPVELRPRRLRAHLRFTVILLTACALYYGGRMVMAMGRHYVQYSQLSGSIRQLKSRTGALQRKLRSREKMQKEMVRILEQYSSGQELLPLLAQLSESLPASVLASNLKLSDSGIDLTLHTTQENVDLADTLRKFPSFKVGTLQNRKVSDTLNMVTLRLKREPVRK